MTRWIVVSAAQEIDGVLYSGGGQVVSDEVADVLIASGAAYDPADGTPEPVAIPEPEPEPVIPASIRSRKRGAAIPVVVPEPEPDNPTTEEQSE